MRGVLFVMGIALAQMTWRDLRPIYSPQALPSTEKPRLVEPRPFQVEWRVSPTVQTLYDKALWHNRYSATIPGYRIQVLATPVRAQADSTRFFLLENFTEQPIYMIYEAPLYKLRVGDFLDRKEALMWIDKYRSVFPGAFIVPDKVLRP